MVIKHRKMGELLLEAGAINNNQLELAMGMHKSGGLRIGEALVLMGFTTEEEIARTLSEQLNIPYNEKILDSSVSTAMLARVPEEFAKKHLILPLEAMIFAIADPLNYTAINELNFIMDGEIRLTISTPSQIKRSINRHYSLYSLAKDYASSNNIQILKIEDTDKNAPEGLNLVDKNKETSPVTLLISNWISKAVTNKACRVSIEHSDDGIIIKENLQLPRWAQDEIVAKLKDMTGLKGEKERSLKGTQLRLFSDDTNIALSASVQRTTHGERVVLELLGNGDCKEETELAS